MIKHGRTPFLSISIRTICSDLMANLAMTFILGTARNDVTRQNRHHATTPAHFAPKIRTAPTRDRVTIQNRHRATPAQFATKLGLRHNGRSRYDPKWPPQFVIATFGSFDYQRVSIWLPLWVCECAIWAFHCTIMALSPLCKICGMGLFGGKNEWTWCIMMGNIKHLIILLILITDFRTFPALSQLSPKSTHKPSQTHGPCVWEDLELKSMALAHHKGPALSTSFHNARSARSAVYVQLCSVYGLQLLRSKSHTSQSSQLMLVEWEGGKSAESC